MAGKQSPRIPHQSAAVLLQGLGYLDEDSAGQTNIFAVEVSNEHACICSTETACAQHTMPTSRRDVARS